MLEFVKGLLDTSAALIGISGLVLALIVLTATSWRPFGRSFRLLRALRSGDSHSGRLSITRELLGLLARTIWWDIAYRRPKHLYQTVRLRIEQNIFQGGGFGTEDQSFEVGNLRSVYWDDGARLHSDTSDDGPPYAIPIQTCDGIYEHSEEVQQYLEALKEVEPDEPAEFLTDVDVRNGFVAPLLLLTGLLHHSEDNWGRIIDAYGRDIMPTNDPLTIILKDGFLRRLQTFQFDCWLLWGPSIPVCGEECYYWTSQIGAVQYGYGDENNSIALIGDRDELNKVMSGSFQHSELAIRTSARGRLKLSGDIAKEVQQEISPALRTAWETEQGMRVVLDLRSSHHAIARLSGSEAEARTTYYSAYIWVLFVITKNGNPIHFDENPKVHWRSFLPFFEHGNIAEGPVSDFMKKQLARKAVSALEMVVSRYEDTWHQPFPLRFALACSIDESGCGMPLDYGVKAPEARLREYLATAIAASTILKDRNIVDFDSYSPVLHPENHPYSACSLPGVLKGYYSDHGDS